jgi:hypothetical protein
MSGFAKLLLIGPSGPAVLLERIPLTGGDVAGEAEAVGSLPFC